MTHPGATVAAVETPGADGFRHELLPYDDLTGYVAVAAAFVRDGLAAGESVLVAVPSPQLDALTVLLLGEPGDLRFVDMSTVGANPARIIELWRTFLDTCTGPARGVGEPIHPSLDTEHLAECARHERLVNLALVGRQFRLLCPCDATGLDDRVVAEARNSHPFTHGSKEANDTYRSDALLTGLFDEALPAPPAGQESLAFGRHDLARLRRFVRAQAEAAGLDGAAAGDLVLAADEVATNTVVHGGADGTIRCWPERGALVCQLEGAGTFTDPMAGRFRPGPESPGGRGLWLANQLCELVQLRNTPAGSVVRLRSRRSIG